MDDICRELDEVTLDFFANLERLQEKRASLSAALRDGHLNLSKARYSMGNKSVGALQYNQNMRFALYHVAVEDIPPEKDNSYTTFQLTKDLPGELMANKESTNYLKDDEKVALRRRKLQKPNDTKDSEELSGIEELNIYSENNSFSDKVRAEGGKIRDPIKWFGILVPGCLRTGQKNFQSAIELSCEIVNLENKQREIIEKFKNLKRRKILFLTEKTKT